MRDQRVEVTLDHGHGRGVGLVVVGDDGLQSVAGIGGRGGVVGASQGLCKARSKERTIPSTRERRMIVSELVLLPPGLSRSARDLSEDVIETTIRALGGKRRWSRCGLYRSR